MKKLNYTQKIGLTAGSAALLVPAIGQATVVHFDSTNAITVSYGGLTSAEWDVDGGGLSDFSLFTSRTDFSSIFLDSGGSLGGRGMLGSGKDERNVNNLNSGFAVGATSPKAYAWGGSSRSYRKMLSNSSTVGRHFNNASLGSNFIGFRFDIGGDLHYGWAEIILSTNTVSINQWAYEDTVGASINVAQTSSGTSPVPEPASLALLAMGVAGIARMRRKQALAA